MNIFAKIGGFFAKFGKVVWSALEQAGIKGLTDEIVQEALAWAKVAAQQTLDNAGKREFVVKMLTSRGIPESIARLAVELAVQLLKKELGKV